VNGFHVSPLGNGWGRAAQVFLQHGCNVAMRDEGP
jgi:hypothetical protein